MEASVIACNNEHFGKAENISGSRYSQRIWETVGKLEEEDLKDIDWVILNFC